MKKKSIIGAILCLFFGMLFFSTFLIPYDNVQITLEGQSPVNGELNLVLPRQIYLGQTAKVTARVQIAAQYSPQDSGVLISRLESSIGGLSPRGEIISSVQPGRPWTMVWKVKPYQTGEFPTFLWISTRGEDGEQLILAREIMLSSRKYLLTRVENIRIASLVVMSVGLMLFVSGIRGLKKSS